MTEPIRLPIADYALLSDCHTAALVSGSGSVDWLCVPRFDGPSVFGRLLDPAGGHWRISPAAEFETERRYLPETLVLETTFVTPTGRAALTDALILGEGECGHHVGRSSPGALVRSLEVIAGRVALEMDFAPRPEFGVVMPTLVPLGAGLGVTGGTHPLSLVASAPMVTAPGVARWRREAAAGERFVFALGWGEAGSPVWPVAAMETQLASTIRSWESWSDLHPAYDGPWAEVVRHSGRVLHGLTFGPTGALLSAPTTSLPEREGGTRNWDYRFAWVRNSAMAMRALWRVTCRDEAEGLAGFLRAAAAGGAGLAAGTGGIRAAYQVDGRPAPAEHVLGHLRGWAGSGPVRVGSGPPGASVHDAYGELAEGAYLLQAGGGGDLPAEMEKLLADLADAALRTWQRADHGMWDSRTEARQFLHGKLMSWIALDRAARLLAATREPDDVRRWAEGADVVRAAILDNAWDPAVGAFVRAFGWPQLDASALLLVHYGFLPVADPRMRATVERIATELSAPCGLLYRYTQDPAEPEEGESTYLPCSFWLAECWASAGELAAAREVFERAMAYANDVGLLAEEAEPATGELMGNFPYAASHVGMINAAWAITHAERTSEVDR